MTITVDQSSAGGLSAIQKPLTIKRKPIVTIDAEVGDIIEAKASIYAISGTCTEGGQEVTVTVTQGDNSATPSPQPTCGGLNNGTSGKWSTTVDVSDRTQFPTGPVVITANHQSANALVATEAKRNVSKLPDVAIGDLADITNKNAGTYAISGTCTEANVNVKVTVSKSSKPLEKATKCKVVDVGSSKGIWEVEVDISGSGFSTGKVGVKAEHEKGSGENAWVAPIVADRNQKSVNRLPHVSIKQDLGDINVGNDKKFTVSGSCSESNQKVSVTVTGKGGSKTSEQLNCLSESWEWDVPMGSDRTQFPTGQVTITAEHSSSSSLGSLLAPEDEVTIDRKPIVTIDAEVGDIKGEAPTAYAISGICTEGGQEVTVTVTQTQGSGSATPSPQPTCGSATTGKWSTTVDVSDRTKFPTGPVTITVNHSNGGSGDLALNAKPATQTVNRFPHVSIDAPATITKSNKKKYPLSGKCSEDGTHVVLSVAGTSVPDVQCGANSKGQWSAEVNISTLGSGAITITADHEKNVAGGTLKAQASRNISKLPVVTLASAPTIDASNAGAYTFSGLCTEDNEPVTVSVENIQPAPQPTCTVGKWEVTLDVSSLGTGEITITVNHNDGGSLKAPTINPKVDKVPSVTVTVDDNLTEINDETSISLSGKCSEASQPVIIKLVGEGQTTNADAHLTSNGITCATSESTWTWPNVDISDRVKFPTGTLTITADHSVSLNVGDPLNIKRL